MRAAGIGARAGWPMRLFDLLYSSDPRVVFAFWVGLSMSLASLVLFVAVLALRRLAQRRERQHLQAVARWRALLEEAMRDGLPARLPPLPGHDMTGFMEAWNALHELPQGVDNLGMHQLAWEVGLAPKLEKIASAGRFHDRVMAIIALGHLRSVSSFSRIEPLLDDPSPIVSISAAHALMRIDAVRAVERVVPQIEARQDWVDGGVAQILSDTDAAVVQGPLSGAALRANDEVAPRMVRFLAGVSPQAAAPVIRRILSEPHDEHLVSTCLQVMAEAADLDKVRPLLAHPRWHVRMHAAAALGRLGSARDAEALLPLLGDTQWWVRYRSAQALQHLLGDDEALARIRERQQDRYARDILTQVLAEHSLQVAA